MEPTRKLAYIYLATLISSLVSVSLPQPIYIAIITSMNVAFAVIMTSTRSPSRLSVALVYILGFSVVFFNSWALYQTLSFFHPVRSEMLTILVYFLIYYVVSFLILKPDAIVAKLASILPKFSLKSTKKSINKDISDLPRIIRMIKYKKSTNEALTVKIGNSVAGTFNIINLEEKSIVVEIDDNLKTFIKEKPTEELDIELLLPTATYIFKASFSSLSPPTIPNPSKLIHISDLDNFRDSFRVSDPKGVTAAVDANGKKMEVHIGNISATGALLEIKSQPLIEYMNASSDYVDVILSLAGELITITSTVINKNVTDGRHLYGIEFKNITSKTQKKLQETIFKELNL
jgi:hypothetical protein